MRDRIADVNGAGFLSGSFAAVDDFESISFLNSDLLGPALREYAGEIDRGNTATLNYVSMRGVSCDCVQGYDVTLDISHS